MTCTFPRPHSLYAYDHIGPKWCNDRVDRQLAVERSVDQRLYPGLRWFIGVDLSMAAMQGKTVFISGASRGIGLAIGKKLASQGANIAIAAKSVTENPKVPGTIYTAAAAIDEAGGKALPLVCDIRNENDVQKAIQETVATFGQLDILVNNGRADTRCDFALGLLRRP